MNGYEDNLREAFALHNRGEHASAETLCRRLMPDGPRDARLHFLLGMLLHRLERGQEALGFLHRARELNPHDAGILNGLGCVHQRLGHHHAAAATFRQALTLKPQDADLYYSLGNALHAVGELESAEEAFRRGAELKPGDAAIWNNLGKTLKDLNRYEASIAAYDRALALKPDYVLAHYGRSISLLASGHLAEGFREYEWRPWHERRTFSQPLWKGEPLIDKTLFLRAEQGFGDAIMMARFVSQLRERGARVVVECRPELKTLFAYSGFAEEVIAYGEAVPAHDFHLSMQSLPFALRVTLSAIPRQVPYLRSPPAMPLSAPGRKVGVVWAGNRGHHEDHLRSLAPAALAPLLAVSGITFYNFQFPGDAGKPLLTLPRATGDFLETAAALAAMDLVIAVDTAVAHLAGAFGKPVWLMLQHSPDWRWFLEFGDKTPWYPTMRLFRQERRGEWAPVLERVARALRAEAVTE